VSPPNSQDNEFTRSVESQSERQRSNSARVTRALAPASSDNDSSGNKQQNEAEESYWKWQNRFQCLLVLFTGGAFAAAAIYAGIASHQLKQMRHTVTEAIRANAIAHQNAVEDLRAYVSVGGGPDHQLAAIVCDPKAHRVVVKTYFFNGGRTPAHNFAANVVTVGLPLSKKWSDFNSGRVRASSSLGESAGKGFVYRFGGLEIPAQPTREARIGFGGIDIPAQSMHEMEIDNKQAQPIRNLKRFGKVKNNLGLKANILTAMNLGNTNVEEYR
jgi:hypothetical protein